MLKKFALLILICVFLVGCTTFRPLIPEKDRLFDRGQEASFVDVQAEAEEIGKQEMRKGEAVRIKYIGFIADKPYFKVYEHKEGKFQFVGWQPETPEEELQELWRVERVLITTYYRPCR